MALGALFSWNRKRLPFTANGGSGQAVCVVVQPTAEENISLRKKVHELEEQIKDLEYQLTQKSKAAVAVEKETNRLGGLYQLCRKRSQQYAAALGLSSGHINAILNLTEQNISLMTEYGPVSIYTFQTCTPFGWEYLMQIRSQSLRLTSVGAGTSYIQVIEDERVNEAILTALKNERYEIKKGNVWP